MTPVRIPVWVGVFVLVAAVAGIGVGIGIGRDGQDEPSQVREVPVVTTTPASPPQATGTPRATSPPTSTPLPATSTPIPSPPATSSPTPAPPRLEVGQSVQSGDGLVLTLEDARIVTFGDGVVLWLTLQNDRSQPLPLRISRSMFSAFDNNNNRLAVMQNWAGYGEDTRANGSEIGEENVIIPPGRTLLFLGTIRGQTLSNYRLTIVANVTSPSLREITFTVSGISTLPEARWRIPIPH
jgi:hypothetical protein